MKWRTRVVGTAVVGLAVVAGLGLQGGESRGAPADSKRVVFIVPGQQLYSGGQAHEDTYGQLATRIRAAGYTVRYIDVGGKQIVPDAERIRAAVDPVARAADYVGLVGHSAGGVSARQYLKFLGGSSRVDHYVAIGAPQYGSPGGCSQPRGQGYDTCVHSDVVKRLNAGPDAPGPTRYSVVQSSGEWADGRLDGRQCRTYVDGVLAANTGGDHIAQLVDQRVLTGVVTSLRGGCAGRVFDTPVDSITWESTTFPGIQGPIGETLRRELPGQLQAPTR